MASVTVTLIRPHTHEGRIYPAGASLEMALHDAQYLLSLKVIDKLPAAKSDKPEKVDGDK